MRGRIHISLRDGTHFLAFSAVAFLLMLFPVDPAAAQDAVATLRQSPSVDVCQPTVDPVPFRAEVAQFRGSRSGRDVLLEWYTLRESSNRGFEVQRASSFSQGWEPAGFVPGVGDAPDRRDYSFRDKNVAPEDLRYMLRVVGNDGIVQYSQIISVPVSAALRSFVVESADRLAAALSARVDLARDDVVSLQLTDVRGNVIESLADRRLLASGRHEFMMDFSKLPAGEYELILNTSEGRYRRTYLHTK